MQQKLGWDRRGILTGEVELNSELTFYTRYGDYLGRISELLMGLCILYYIAYRIKKKNHLGEVTGTDIRPLTRPA